MNNEFFKQAKEIKEGFENLIKSKLGLLEKDVKLEAERRLPICLNCPLRVDDTCSRENKGKVVKTFTYYNKIREEGDDYNGCGCSLHAKVLSPDTKCPLGKWEKETKSEMRVLKMQDFKFALFIDKEEETSLPSIFFKFDEFVARGDSYIVEKLLDFYNAYQINNSKKGAMLFELIREKLDERLMNTDYENDDV